MANVPRRASVPESSAECTLDVASWKGAVLTKTKRCWKCDTFKPISEFRKDRTKMHGISGCCKPCHAERSQEYYRNNREMCRANRREYSKVYDKKRGPERKIMSRAHAAVRWAIKVGKLKRLPCEICASEPSEAHHDDYSKPLDVRWLCRSHHAELHWKQRLSAQV